MPATAPPKATIGDNIRAARERKNMTQISLAKKLGYVGNGSAISHLETGHQQPRLETINKIAKAHKTRKGTQLRFTNP